MEFLHPIRGMPESPINNWVQGTTMFLYYFSEFHFGKKLCLHTESQNLLELGVIPRAVAFGGFVFWKRSHCLEVPCRLKETEIHPSQWNQLLSYLHSPQNTSGLEFPKMFWPSYIKIVTTAKSTSSSSSTRSGFGYLESGFQLPASCAAIYTRAKWVYNTT